MSKIYVAEYRGYTASVYEQDEEWRVNPVVMPDDGLQEKGTRDGMFTLPANPMLGIQPELRHLLGSTWPGRPGQIENRQKTW